MHKYFRRTHTNAHTYYNSYRDDSTANTNSNSDVYTNTNTNSDAHSDRDTYGYIYANADSYVHTDSNAYRYSLANVNSDCYSYIHANGNSDIHADFNSNIHPDSNSNSYFYTYADNYFHADSNAYRYSHTNVNSDCHSYIYANSNSDVHADSNANSYGYVYAYTDSYFYTYADSYFHADSNADSYSYADTAERMCSISRVLEKSPSSVAGESVTAWEHHLQPATIVVDSGAANPWQWISSTGSSGNCRKTQYCQWRERELYPANIGRGRYFDRRPGHSASGPWIPETEWRRAHAYPIQLRRVVRSSVHFASAADANFIPFSAGAADATTTAMRRRGIRLERSCC